MLKIKIGSFFEEHIDKMVLIVVGLVCAWLLITRVILSPNQVTYNGTKYSPSSIDTYVSEEAKNLKEKMNDPFSQPEPYKPKVDEFLALMNSSISDINLNLWFQLPYAVAGKSDIHGTYRLPRIGDVTEVEIEHIRAVAYVPTDRITELNTYERVRHEPNDIDLVTVEAKFNIQELYERFKESFILNVEEKMADPCLAKPLFASVQLQRQQLNNDGTWSDWQVVPRSKIDSYSRLFSLSENVDELPPGGLKVQMLQFENKMVQIDLLQPQAYQIASAREEWFPPELHKKFLVLQKKDILEEKRLNREAERQERESDNTNTTNNPRRQSRRQDRTGTMGGGRGSLETMGGGRGGIDIGDTGRGSRRTRGTAQGGIADRGARTTDRGQRGRGNRTDTGIYDGGSELYGGIGGGQQAPLVTEVYEEYYELLLDPTTDFADLKEPITFWAHDDTVEPKNTYKYRIRLGVFNPVAGRNGSDESASSQNNKVILWSNYSPVTETVTIRGRLYFFAKDIQEAAKTVTVTVCKYALGHWYKQDFKVREGEVIGSVVDIEKPEPEKITSTTPTRRTTSLTTTTRTTGTTGEITVPEQVDYGTNALMVDAVAMTDWLNDINIHNRYYYNMLYSYDGTTIEHMPIKLENWNDDLRSAYSYVINLEREPQEPFKAWGSGALGTGMYGDSPYPGGMRGGMENMMMDRGAGGGVRLTR